MEIRRRRQQTVKGIGMIPQRLAILNYLDGNTSHPSAEDIYNAVSKKSQPCLLQRLIFHGS